MSASEQNPTPTTTDGVPELPGMTGERVRALVSVIVTTYALVQSILAARGWNPLPFTSDQVSTTVFALIGVVGSIYNWWTHNAVTTAGYVGKLTTAQLKINQRADVDNALPVDAANADTATDSEAK